jgi:hypothetical protein
VQIEQKILPYPQSELGHKQQQDAILIWNVYPLTTF